MATSIHVYDDIETFNKVYKGWLLEPLKNVKIKDMYIYDKRKLWVVTNTNDQKEQPRLQHSLVHFRNGNIYGYQDEKTKICFNYGCNWSRWCISGKFSFKQRIQSFWYFQANFITKFLAIITFEYRR